MGARADVGVCSAQNGMYTGAGHQNIVETVGGVLYAIFSDTAADLIWKKSTDGGLSWTPGAAIFTGTITAMAVWYDRWSNISAGLIHIAYVESGTDDTRYRTINTESSDALSTETTIFLGASAVSGGTLSICRSRGGNVYCATMIDAGAEGGFFRLPNANVPNGAWDAARATVFEAATQDQVLLTPGFAADNQDIIAIFWDASADELSRKIYDDSANTWTETSIATSMVDQAATTAYPHFAIAVDLTNSRTLMVAWSAVDAANADLRCWTITESAITETSANVVLNSTDDQGLCGIRLDLNTGYWWVAYGGKSDGTETYLTSIHIYCKVSKDSGATWGPETLLTTRATNVRTLWVAPRGTLPISVLHYIEGGSNWASDDLYCNVQVVQPLAGHQMYGG